MAKIDRRIKVMKNDLLKTGYLALSGPTVISDRKTDGQSKQERAALFATKKGFRNVQAIIYSYFCNASSLLSIIIIQIMHTQSAQRWKSMKRKILRKNAFDQVGK